MIRFLCLNALIAILTIIFCLWGFVLAAYKRSENVLHSYVAVPWAKMILRVCGVKVKVKGQENVKDNVPRIYLTNHQSYFDIFALLAHLPGNFKFILKEELMKIPLFGFCMKRAGYIAIHREDPRKALKSMNEAAKKIKNGSSVVIFPEGTRSRDGHLQPFKRGGFRLALKSGCEIVPVAIINSGDIVPKGSLRINKGSFSLNICKPISAKDYSKKNMNQLMARVREDIIKRMRETN
jgi:1-acyl-sn-glycerol-3-phosphate acyltransferase